MSPAGTVFGLVKVGGLFLHQIEIVVPGRRIRSPGPAIVLRTTRLRLDREIASAYARLGSEVQLFEALDRVLPTEDADVSKIAERGFKKQGIDVHTGVLVSDVVSSENAVTVHHDLVNRPGRKQVPSFALMPGLGAMALA